jgi:hypothetical protein
MNKSDSYNIKCRFLEEAINAYDEFITPTLHGLSERVVKGTSAIRDSVTTQVAVVQGPDYDPDIDPDEFNRGPNDLTPVDPSMRDRASLSRGEN